MSLSNKIQSAFRLKRGRQTEKASEAVKLEGNEYADVHTMIAKSMAETERKMNVLRDIDVLVLDNSLRESTVGQLKGHTLENKWSILETVKECGFKHIIVSAFSHVPRVDDEFVSQLSVKEPHMDPYYAFSEIGEGEDKQELPIGLKKMKKFKIPNPIFEIDLADFDLEKTEEICKLLQERIEFSFENLSPSSRILVNLRDFPSAMLKNPDRVFDVVKFLGTRPADKRPFGIIYEEPTGAIHPMVLMAWTTAIRTVMDRCGWTSGHFLVHIHEKWGFAQVTQLACLESGANGVWASVCEEGASLGHACSAVTLMNLVRYGNTKVLENYNCTFLREAAIRVTKNTTDAMPHSKMPIYGERALDIAFDFGGICGGRVGKGEFDMAKFFGVEPPQRISTLASTDFVKQRLIDLFGPHEQFTDEIAARMKEVMIEDLTNNRKEEYMSHVGLAMLFDRADGKLTERMSDVIAELKVNSEAHQVLIKNVREIWDEWDCTEEEVGDECLEFYSFYNGFMAPYFGCYECDTAKKALQAIDMDSDGKVDWKEFLVYLKWALNEYPAISTPEELLSTAFQKGLIPAMQDEVLKERK